MEFALTSADGNVNLRGCHLPPLAAISSPISSRCQRIPTVQAVFTDFECAATPFTVIARSIGSGGAFQWPRPPSSSGASRGRVTRIDTLIHKSRKQPRRVRSQRCPSRVASRTTPMIQRIPMRKSRDTAENSGRSSRVRDLGSLVTKSVSAWLAHNASSMGAALAFYTLFSVAPILVIALCDRRLRVRSAHGGDGIARELRGPDRQCGCRCRAQSSGERPLQRQKGSRRGGRRDHVAHRCDQRIRRTPHALDQIWGTPPAHGRRAWWDFLRTRLLSFGMVLGVGFLLLVSLIVSAALAAFDGWLETRVTAADDRSCHCSILGSASPWRCCSLR